MKWVKVMMMIVLHCPLILLVEICLPTHHQQLKVVKQVEIGGEEEGGEEGVESLISSSTAHSMLDHHEREQQKYRQNVRNVRLLEISSVT